MNLKLDQELCLCVEKDVKIVLSVSITGKFTSLRSETSCAIILTVQWSPPNVMLLMKLTFQL